LLSTPTGETGCDPTTAMGVVHTKFSEGVNLFIRNFNTPLEINSNSIVQSKISEKTKTVDAIRLDNLEQCFPTFLLKVAQITFGKNCMAHYLVGMGYACICIKNTHLIFLK